MREHEGISKPSAIIGSILLVLALIGVIYALKTTKTVKNKVVENGSITTEDKGYGKLIENIPPTAPSSENVSPLVVKGTATEILGRRFNFYIFNKVNFDIFQAGENFFVPIKTGINVTSLNFEFTPPYQGNYYFVASTVEPPLPRTVILTVSTEWQTREINWTLFVGCTILIVIILWIWGIPFEKIIKPR